MFKKAAEQEAVHPLNTRPTENRSDDGAHPGEGQLESSDFVEILNTKIHTISVETLFAFISQTIETDGKAIVANVNIHALNLAYEQPWFRQFLNRSQIVFCDGVGIQVGARILGHKIPHRYTPPDWLRDLCSLCVERDYSLYLLGAREGVAEQAALRLRAENPALRIVGTHHGYFDKGETSVENQAVIDDINGSQPDILVVGFGMPLQERWLQENWEEIHAKIALPVGAAIDYLAGTVYRAPRWVTDNGFEWLARLVIEPKRLWRRYLFGIPTFFWRVLVERFTTRSG